jgi:hypothetical protein
MEINSISIKNNYYHFNLKRDIKEDNIIIKDNIVSIKSDSEIIIKFRFYQKITKTDSREFDNLMSTLKSMAIELTKIAKEKGRKRITVIFPDTESAVKIASFEHGKFFKQYLSIANMIVLSDEIIYQNDKDIKDYTITPKVIDYSIKTKTEYYEPKTLSIKITNKIVHKYYMREESISP